MRRILILVEGQTEEAFIKHVLAPHFLNRETYLFPTIITTKRVKRGTDFKGGVPPYSRFKREIQRLLHDSHAALVTTMLDYYQLPHSFPGREQPKGKTPIEKVKSVEKAIAADMQHPKCYPYLALHEFESLLFSEPRIISKTLIMPETEQDVQQIRDAFASPEDINDHPKTAPSQRLLNLFPHYSKVYYGRLIAERIGLETIRKECTHFDEWVTSLESLS